MHRNAANRLTKNSLKFEIDLHFGSSNSISNFQISNLSQ